MLFAVCMYPCLNYSITIDRITVIVKALDILHNIMVVKAHPILGICF